MDKIRADLHVHSKFSDGLEDIKSVVAEAARCGVGMLSVTDHDTYLGCGEFKEECKKREIIPVVGSEISAYEKGVKVHILAYEPNLEDAGFKLFMRDLYLGSLERAEDILKKLRSLGVDIKKEEVDEQRYCLAAPVHTMHIARVGVKKGYASTDYQFYNKYLTRGGAAFSDVGRPSPERTVEIISSAGGKSVIAHPGRVELGKAELKDLILRLKAFGLCGIEAVYSTHTLFQTAYYKELAKDAGLLITGGSDTHRIGGSKKIGTPKFFPDETLLHVLKID